MRLSEDSVPCVRHMYIHIYICRIIYIYIYLPTYPILTIHSYIPSIHPSSIHVLDLAIWLPGTYLPCNPLASASACLPSPVVLGRQLWYDMPRSSMGFLGCLWLPFIIIWSMAKFVRSAWVGSPRFNKNVQSDPSTSSHDSTQVMNIPRQQVTFPGLSWSMIHDASISIIKIYTHITYLIIYIYVSGCGGLFVCWDPPPPGNYLWIGWRYI